MIEIVSRGAHAGETRVVLFDFDGTLSLIRAGWMDVMVPMMVDLLQTTGSGETTEELRETGARIRRADLTGKETIYQMMAFADHLRAAASRRKSLCYKRMYLEPALDAYRGPNQGTRIRQRFPESIWYPGREPFSTL